MNMKSLINNNYQIYLEMALIINKEMYESHNIPYDLFKVAEDSILKKIKCTNEENN